MSGLKGYQKTYLKGLAHKLKPVVFVGQKGATDKMVAAVNEALDSHELIKLKFVDFKDKEDKLEITNMIEKKSHCEKVGMIGHIAIYFRQHNDPEKRKIKIPERS